MQTSREIMKAFTVDGDMIDINPTTTAAEIVQSRGLNPATTDLVQTTNSGSPKIIKSNQRFDPSQGQLIDFQIHGEEGV